LNRRIFIFLFDNPYRKGKAKQQPDISAGLL
jgi:hypothetical protein